MKTMRFKHLTDLGYNTSEGNFIPTRITLRYTLDGNNILYQFACCSHNDQYVKKIGNRIAAEQTQHTIPMDSVFDDEKLSTSQMIMTMMVDIEKNRVNDLPFRHRMFFQENSPSEFIEEQRGVYEMTSQLSQIINALTSSIDEDETEEEESPTIH